MKSKYGGIMIFLFFIVAVCLVGLIVVDEKTENNPTIEFEVTQLLTMEKIEEILQIIDSAGAEMIELRILNGDKIEYRIRFQKKEGK